MAEIAGVAVGVEDRSLRCPPPVRGTPPGMDADSLFEGQPEVLGMESRRGVGPAGGVGGRVEDQPPLEGEKHNKHSQVHAPQQQDEATKTSRPGDPLARVTGAGAIGSARDGRHVYLRGCRAPGPPPQRRADFQPTRSGLDPEAQPRPYGVAPCDSEVTLPVQSLLAECQVRFTVKAMKIGLAPWQGHSIQSSTVLHFLRIVRIAKGRRASRGGAGNSYDRPA